MWLAGGVTNISQRLSCTRGHLACSRAGNNALRRLAGTPPNCSDTHTWFCVGCRWENRANLDRGFARRQLHQAFLSGAAKSPMNEVYKEQFKQVNALLAKGNGFLHEIEKATLDYYNNLGLNRYYFETSQPETIAGHIQCVLAANLLRKYSQTDYFPVIHQRGESEVVVISRASLSNRTASQNYAVEKMLESQYLHLDGSQPSWRLQGYRSEGSVFDDKSTIDQRLRTCFLQRPTYLAPPETVSRDETNLEKLLDTDFYKHIQGTETERIFHDLNEAVVRDHTGVGLRVHKGLEDESTYRVTFAFRRNVGLEGFYSNLGDIVTTYGMYSQRKHVEPLANGVSILTCFLKATTEDIPVIRHLSFHERVEEVIKAAYMRHVLPRSRYNALCLERKLHTLEASYCHAAAKFAFQFSQTVGPSFSKIARVLENSHDVTRQDLYDVRSRLKQSALTEDLIFRTVSAHPKIVTRLFQEFQTNHDPRYVTNGKYIPDAALEADIQRLDDADAHSIFHWFLKFNRSILKTNFFKDDRVALAFRCDPSFLPDADFEHKPHAIVFFVGSNFRGFHSRFAEVARGGIRVVQSMSVPAYQQNSLRAFDEVYKLSRTQNFKNKDIPEGGSKGVILLDPTSTPEAAAALTRTSFFRYVDAFLDILLPNKDVVDRYGKPEICFLGPDEHTGTGGLMDWASLHAKVRGAWFWKAFTTGKDRSLGGIPHDLYGMTTTSVETYVKGVLEKLGKRENETTKCQTGGPDGDLGANSILMSTTKLTSLIDGAGVLSDPNGLARDELLRLVQRRFDGLPTSSMMFDEAKLSPAGFKVPVSARDVTLPNGTVVQNGLTFRNTFHLNPLASAFLFNPNGGRPESITPYNVDQLFEKDGTPRYRVIVEGANVFITDDARVALEKRGVVLFKDASTNKGGVTSSSLEVLAALALDDASFESMMCVRDPNNPPQFYRDYVSAVQQKIRENAESEFELLWREGERTGIPRSKLTDVVSGKIIQLKSEVLASPLLWNDDVLRATVLYRSIPSVLMPGVISLDTLTERVPESYLRAVFASYLASQFYYSHGLDASSFAFMEFVQCLKNTATTESCAVNASTQHAKNQELMSP